MSIIFLCGFSLIANAGEPSDSLFVNANAAYSEGNFEQAFDLYQQIQSNGLESPELYYNMGNSAFRSNKLGFAILYYEKALKLDPGFSDARNNLSYVSVYKEDKLDQVPELFIRVWIKALFKLFSVSQWSYIALALFFLGLSGIIIYIFAGSLVFKKVGFFTGMTAILLFALSFSATINRNSELKNPGSAVITTPSVVIKSSPSLSGTDLFVLHEGTKVSVHETVGEWIEIKISDGRVGWMQNTALQLI